nr:hypothetical protein [Psychrobacter sp. PraFG1]UNK06025.1 hypothetical protein MN210_04845 [Psychrobacter sp. PraFG1]
MSLIELKGNIFCTKAQTIVNTVNCVGVMGAGIALECKLRYPEMFRSMRIFVKLVCLSLENYGYINKKALGY